MACGVCGHCEALVSRNECAVHGGYSYHKKCHKCYVCSETNLHNAELFKGVIFCSSCSQRIFQGCFTARRTKKTSGASRSKRSPTRSHKRRERSTPRRNKKAEPITRGVIELARLAGSVHTTSSEDSQKKTKSRKSLSTELTLQVGKEMYETNKSCKKDSTEMGMTTEVTQELLRQINCPVVTACKYRPPQPPNPKHSQRIKGDVLHKNVCSDLRIAELGMSTEIANMALRKKSEQAVIIKSRSHLKNAVSLTFSVHNQESDMSADGRIWWNTPRSSLDDFPKTRWIDRRIGSLLKMPYKSFKKNILTRSSLVSVMMNGPNDKQSLLQKFKLLFHEEIAEHQNRGVKKLYPTINERKVPYQLGWLELAAKTHPDSRTRVIRRRCKHFKRSHSYRCMRAQVMRLAGPTRSELVVLRKKIKSFIAPNFLKKMVPCNIRPQAITQACGSSERNSLGKMQEHLEKP